MGAAAHNRSHVKKARQIEATVDLSAPHETAIDGKCRQYTYGARERTVQFETKRCSKPSVRRAQAVGFSRKRELRCHQGLRTLHAKVGGRGWTNRRSVRLQPDLRRSVRLWADRQEQRPRSSVSRLREPRRAHSVRDAVDQSVASFPWLDIGSLSAIAASPPWRDLAEAPSARRRTRDTDARGRCVRDAVSEATRTCATLGVRSGAWLSGRAFASHARGRWFDSTRAHHPDKFVRSGGHTPSSVTRLTLRVSQRGRSRSGPPSPSR
jgi:hypothetical protein